MSRLIASHFQISDLLKTARASLVMEWDLLGFLKSQYPEVDKPDLGSVITLSGTVLHAQATTCSAYAQQTWPSQGQTVVSAFQSAIDECGHTAQGSLSLPCRFKGSIVEFVLTFASLDYKSPLKY